MLFTLVKSFQTCMTYFLQLNPKEDILKNAFVNTLKVSSSLPSQRKPGEVDLLSSVGQKGALP